MDAEQKKRPILRYLRIAFSALNGILCLLLIGLWVRSYYILEEVYWKPSPRNAFGVWSGGGRIILTIHPKNTIDPIKLAYMGPFNGSWRSVVERQDTQLRALWGFGAGRAGYQLEQAMMPYWFTVLSTAILSAIPWLPWVSWRFSLRTLLIAVTFVAVVLGFLVVLN